MKLHIYFDENDTAENLTNFDFAREVINRCNDNYNLDIKTVVKMLQAQIEFMEKDKDD